MVELSVIIVSYDAQYFLELCLESVEAAVKNIHSEVIVVDNNSSDLSCQMIRNRFPGFKLICNKENKGFSKANNQGVKTARGKYILILNPDTFLAEDTLEQTLSFLKQKNRPGALGIRFIDGTGNFLPESKRNIPTLRVAGQKLRGNSKRYYATHIREEEIAEVDILTGAFMLIGRETYMNVGGFDEDYFMFGEDIDLSYKLLNAGYRNYYFGQTTMIHFKGESTEKDQTYLKNFYGAMQIFYRKHFKSGKINELFLNLAVKSMILIKSVKNELYQTDKIKEFKTSLYLGHDAEILKRIKKVNPQTTIKMNSDLSKDISFYECIIFDSRIMTAKKIISFFNRFKGKNTSKRILSKDSFFYLGSDSSVIKGEVVIL